MIGRELLFTRKFDDKWFLLVFPVTLGDIKAVVGRVFSIEVVEVIRCLVTHLQPALNKTR